MDFRLYNALWLFTSVAHHVSFTAAGDELNLTKGAISYQIKQLEQELGFEVFVRHPSGIVLTEKGKTLWHTAQLAFQDIEQQIAYLREADPTYITIGTTTYFASRWLSPRLMTFITAYPDIKLRLQPVVTFTNLRTENIDLMIRWGKADWPEMYTELLFLKPVVPTAGASIANLVQDVGLREALPKITLLHDREDSDVWQDWHKVARVPYRPKQHSPIIPDPNVRVQAVIDGQGIALNDTLIAPEITDGKLFQISPIELTNYGYFLFYPRGALNNPSLQVFRDWIVAEAEQDQE